VSDDIFNYIPAPYVKGRPEGAGYYLEIGFAASLARPSVNHGILAKATTRAGKGEQIRSSSQGV
jgi:hypothetical protein